MHASVNMGCQGKSGPGKIHEVILVKDLKPALNENVGGEKLFFFILISLLYFFPADFI